MRTRAVGRSISLILAMIIIITCVSGTAMAISFKVKADGSANVRLCAGGTTKVSSGTVMTVTACRNGWARVKKDGQSGYIRISDIKPSTGSANGNAAALALMQIGKPYGNNEPSSFNCSSLAYYCFRKYGKSVPGTAKGIAADNSMRCISYTGDLKIGDILCFDTDEDNSCDHVGIFVGDGKFVEASQSKHKVQINNLDSWYKRHMLCARRP